MTEFGTITATITFAFVQRLADYAVILNRAAHSAILHKHDYGEYPDFEKCRDGYKGFLSIARTCCELCIDFSYTLGYLTDDDYIFVITSFTVGGQTFDPAEISYLIDDEKPLKTETVHTELLSNGYAAFRSDDP